MGTDQDLTLIVARSFLNTRQPSQRFQRICPAGLRPSSLGRRAPLHFHCKCKWGPTRHPPVQSIRPSFPCLLFCRREVEIHRAREVSQRAGPVAASETTLLSARRPPISPKPRPSLSPTNRFRQSVVLPPAWTPSQLPPTTQYGVLVQVHSLHCPTK